LSELIDKADRGSAIHLEESAPLHFLPNVFARRGFVRELISAKRMAATGQTFHIA